nr:unnamed protein product [Callosobruchus analis]
MSIRDIDKILNELSVKFNRIFYDRDFICSVLEDFRVILENKDKCCIVVIFPALGPSYLKAIQYQAELFDLATFTLGSRRLLCVCVCFKQYTIRNVQSCGNFETGNEMPEPEAGCSMRVRKKRPEKQLYIPPAQRISLKKYPDSVQKLDNGSQKQKKVIIERKDSRKEKTKEADVARAERKLKPNEGDSFYQQDLSYFCNDFVEYFLWSYTFSVQWRYKVPESESSFVRDNSVMKAYIFFKTSTMMFNKTLYTIPLYFCCPIARLEVLRRDIFLWQPNCYHMNIYRRYNTTNFELICDYMDDVNEPILDTQAQILIPVTVNSCDREINMNIYFKEEYSAYNNMYCLFDNHYSFFEDNTFEDIIEEILHDILGPENPQKSDNVESTTFQAASEAFIISDDNSDVNFVFSRSLDAFPNQLEEIKNPKAVFITTDIDDITTQVSECAISPRLNRFCPEDVLAPMLELDGSSQSCKDLGRSEITNSPASRSDAAVGENSSVIDEPSQSDNIKCKLTPVLVISDAKSGVNCTKPPVNPRLDDAVHEKDVRKRTEHDEEKEIMKKTRENINRRIKPIMKYVEADNNTLCINKDDNLNNWEDLFSDDGQLHEDLVEEVS